MTNWFRGIDSGLSTAGGTQVALAGYKFVDIINGNDVTGDGSPDNPYASLNYAIDQNRSNTTFVVADGAYLMDLTTNSYNWTNIQVISNRDKGSILYNTGGNIMGNGSQNIAFRGLIMYEVTPRGTFSRFDCLCINSVSRNYRVDNQLQQTVDSFLKNVRFGSINQFSDNILRFKNSTLHDCVIDFNSSPFGILEISNCDLFNVDIELSNGVNLTDSFIRNCNMRNVTITNNDGGSIAIIQENNIDSDPLNVGDPDKLELLIQPTSPLIGAGENGTTIGAFRVGELVDLSTPDENNNLTIGSTIFPTSPINFGNVVPQNKVFTQIRKSPIVKVNGLLDGTNIGVSGVELTPFKTVLNISYKGTFGDSVTTKRFVYGLPMYLDNQTPQRSTGEEDFNAFDISSTGDILGNPDNLSITNLIDVAEIQPDFEVIKDFEYGGFKLRFDGSNDLANDSVSYNMSDTGSVVAWISPYQLITTPSPRKIIFQMTDLGGGVAYFALDIDAAGVGDSGFDGKASFRVWSNGTAESISVTANYIIGEKILIICSVDRISEELTITLFNKENPTGLKGVNASPALTTGVSIDDVRISSDGGLTVDVDVLEVGYIDGELISDDRASEIWASSRGRDVLGFYNTTELIYYPIDEGSGTVINDSGSNGFDLAMTGFTGTFWISL